MKAIVCEKCGATQKKLSSKCDYCQETLFLNLDISSENKEKLIQYLTSLEKTLHQVRKANDFKILMFFIVFVVFVFGWISVTLYNILSGMHFFLVAIVIGVVFFAIFGFYVQSMERKAIQNFYEKKLNFEIDDFLQNLGCSRHHFRMFASEITDEESPLFEILAEF